MVAKKRQYCGSRPPTLSLATLCTSRKEREDNAFLLTLSSTSTGKAPRGSSILCRTLCDSDNDLMFCAAESACLGCDRWRPTGSQNLFRQGIRLPLLLHLPPRSRAQDRGGLAFQPYPSPPPLKTAVLSPSRAPAHCRRRSPPSLACGKVRPSRFAPSAARVASFESRCDLLQHGHVTGLVGSGKREQRREPRQMIYCFYLFDRNGVCLYYEDWNRAKKPKSLPGGRLSGMRDCLHDPFHCTSDRSSHTTVLCCRRAKAHFRSSLLAQGNRMRYATRW